MGEESVRILCGITAQYLIKDRVLLEIAEDAYSPTCELTVNSQMLKLPMELENRVEVLTADPAFQDGKVLDMVFMPEQPVQYRDGDMVNLEVPGQFRFLYRDPEGNLQSVTENWSTTLTVPAADNTRLHPTIAAVDPSDAGAQIKLNLQTWADQQMPMISALTVGGSKPLDEGRPSLILHPMDTDSLWELAKANGSTMDAIRRANQLTQDPQQGQMLLIPVT